MTTLTHLLVFGAAAPLSRLLFRERARHWLMLVGSVLAIYWLQPLSSIRYLDFWLPTATLALTVWVWVLTRPKADDGRRTTDNRPSTQGAAVTAEVGVGRDALWTAAVVVGLVMVVGLMRYLGPVCCL